MTMRIASRAVDMNDTLLAGISFGAAYGILGCFDGLGDNEYSGR